MVQEYANATGTKSLSFLKLQGEEKNKKQKILQMLELHTVHISTGGSRKEKQCMFKTTSWRLHRIQSRGPFSGVEHSFSITHLDPQDSILFLIIIQVGHFCLLSTPRPTHESKECVSLWAALKGTQQMTFY